MKITEVIIRRICNEPRLKGYASITFDNDISINEVKIIKAERGLCVEFPKDPRSVQLNGETVVIRNQGTRNYVESVVLNAYRDYFERKGKNHGKGFANSPSHGYSYPSDKHSRMQPAHA